MLGQIFCYLQQLVHISHGFVSDCDKVVVSGDARQGPAQVPRRLAKTCICSNEYYIINYINTGTIQNAIAITVRNLLLLRWTIYIHILSLHLK